MQHTESRGWKEFLKKNCTDASHNGCKYIIYVNFFDFLHEFGLLVSHLMVYDIMKGVTEKKKVIDKITEEILENRKQFGEKHRGKTYYAVWKEAYKISNKTNLTINLEPIQDIMNYLSKECYIIYNNVKKVYTNNQKYLRYRCLDITESYEIAILDMNERQKQFNIPNTNHKVITLNNDNIHVVNRVEYNRKIKADLVRFDQLIKNLVKLSI
ncbi:hypothetical protein THOM_1409 [Trachipleistophora hominis]|uniref:Uncharacterized protein n=1 Tax=Trachipleistophora hominis TaxID=72359 RepID=L7JVY2_TRAHO|nr:hypothetical protein THOM_1409 [Trachipleistophora hominis]